MKHAFHLAFALCLAAGAVQAEPFDLLRRGGVTLYLRHAQSDWAGEAEPQPSALKSGRDCSHERNLTEEGRADARAMGLALKGLSLTISEIEAVDLCRAQETARLAFGEPKTLAGISPGAGAPVSLGAQAQRLEAALRPPVSERAVRVIVGDYEVAQALFGVTLAEGEGLILKSDAAGHAQALARISVTDWRALAPVAASAAAPGSRGL